MVTETLNPAFMNGITGVGMANDVAEHGLEKAFTAFLIRMSEKISF